MLIAEVKATIEQRWSGILYDGCEGTYTATDAASMKSLQAAITTTRFRVHSKSHVESETVQDGLKSLAAGSIDWFASMVIMVGNRRNVEDGLVDGDGYRVTYTRGSTGHDLSYTAVQVPAAAGSVTFEDASGAGEGHAGFVQQRPMQRPLMSMEQRPYDEGPGEIAQRPYDGPIDIEQRPMSFMPEDIE